MDTFETRTLEIVEKECERLVNLLMGNIKMEDSHVYLEQGDTVFQRRERLAKTCDKYNIEWRKE